MHAETFQLRAAIGLSTSTRNTAATRQIWLDRTAIAHTKPARVISEFDHFDTKLMSENSGVIEKRLASGKRVQVSATHSDSMHAHQRVAGHPNRFGSIGGNKAARFFEGNLKHWGR